MKRWMIFGAGLAVFYSVSVGANGAGGADPMPTCKQADMHTNTGEPLPPIDSTAISLPATGMEATAEVGQSMLLTGKLNVYSPKITIQAPVTANDGKHFEVTIPAGTLRFNSGNDVKRYYVSQGAQAYYKKKLRPEAFSGLIVPVDPEQPWQTFTMARGMRLDLPAPTAKDGAVVSYCTMTGGGGFQRELVYSGGSQGTVSLLYREYSDDVARPAFTQQLTYDLAAGNEIGFKGARIKILSVTNLGVKYVVERGFDGAPAG